MATEVVRPPSTEVVRSSSREVVRPPASPRLPVNTLETGGLPSPADPANKKLRSGYKRISSLWTAMLLTDAKLEGKVDTKIVKTGSENNIAEALYDQGDHEVEVAAEGFEASEKWAKCQKNVGHVGFIQSVKFSMNDLPAQHRDLDIYNYITLWSQLVVRIMVHNISLDRPQGYAFYNFRGKRLPIWGSGKVAEISPVEDSPCPCPECSQSSSPKMKWKALWVMTAMHVVFDDSEATETDIEFFYNQPDNKDGVRKLRGVRVVDSNIKGDWCKFECASHDLDLCQMLEEMDSQVVELGRVINEKHDAHNFPSLAVIASHPHGCSKHITIGEWKERMLVQNREENYEWTEYLYTTPTCFGCSGAPVWIIGPERTHYTYNYYSHVHSEGLKSGLNKSGAGDVEKRWDMY